MYFYCWQNCVLVLSVCSMASVIKRRLCAFNLLYLSVFLQISTLWSLFPQSWQICSLVFVALSQIYARFVSWSVSLGNRQTGTDPCGISVFPIAPPYGLVVCAWLYFVEFLFCAISYLTLSLMSGFVSLVNFLFCAVFAKITIRQFCSVGSPMRGMCGLW